MVERRISTSPAMRQMIEDLTAVAAVQSDVLQKLSATLSEQQGFLNDERLADILEEVIHDESQVSAVFNTLQNLSATSVPEVLETVANWRSPSSRGRESFSDETLAELRQKLPTLIRDYPALNRMKKADRLRNVLGNELRGVLFICDARPVYDESRQVIEGMIPITTLKLVYERQSLAMEEIEIALTSEQLGELIREATEAETKVKSLRALIARSIPGGCVESEEDINAG